MPQINATVVTYTSIFFFLIANGFGRRSGRPGHGYLLPCPKSSCFEQDGRSGRRRQYFQDGYPERHSTKNAETTTVAASCWIDPVCRVIREKNVPKVSTDYHERFDSSNVSIFHRPPRSARLQRRHTARKVCIFGARLGPCIDDRLFTMSWAVSRIAGLLQTAGGGPEYDGNRSVNGAQAVKGWPTKYQLGVDLTLPLT